MRQALSQLLKGTVRSLGFEVRRSGLGSREDLRLAHFLARNGVNLVLDIGANRGQFAQQLFGAGYGGRIVSFEALPDAHAALISAEAGNSRWTIAPQVALSTEVGVSQFHVTAADTASSLLRPSDELVDAAPTTRATKTIEVPTAPLDKMVQDLALAADGCFVKIDVQGAELLVLAGAKDVLSKAKGIVIEISLSPLYEGQPLAWEIVDMLRGQGFEIWDVNPGYRNAKTQRLEQIDVVGFRP